MSLDRELLLELAADHGTPLYVYDSDMVVQRYRDLSRYITWSKLRVLYAMKANYNPALLQDLNAIDAWLDTVSPGDVILAKRLGFSPDRLLYTANNLTDEEVAQVVAEGVLMNFDALSRLERFGAAYPGSRVCLRFNPEVVDGGHAKIMTGGDLTKFGILLSDADKVVAIARQHNLKIVGLHEHTGSGLTRADSVYQSMENLLSIATPERFPDLEFVDFGGGFKVPYKPDEERIDYAAFGARITEIFAAFCARFGRELWMYFEPGKFIVAEAGYMLVTVNTIKANRTRLIAGCDSGFPQLIRPVFYDAYHQIDNLSNPDGERHTYDVVGNICETGDRFAEQRELPEIREGDVLAIRNAGAYCYAMGGVYNLRPMPAEIVVRGGEPHFVRRALSSRELIDQLLGECSL
jgi:diaminopimelate decarboxylase